MEDIELILELAKEHMEKALDHLHFSFGKIRAGKASPSILDGIMVEYYGTMTPLNQVSSINTPDARSIIIKPWEKTIIPQIEKSIINSDIGLNPQNDGNPKWYADHVVEIALEYPGAHAESLQAPVRPVCGEACEEERIS